MVDTRILSRNPFDTLLVQGGALRDLLDRVEDLGPMQIRERKELLRKVEGEIALHVWAQDLLVFPKLLELQDKQVREEVCRRMAEHRALQMLLVDVREAPTPLLFDLAILRLRLQVSHHLDDEEKKIHPLAVRLSPGTLRRLSDRIEAREWHRGG